MRNETQWCNSINKYWNEVNIHIRNKENNKISDFIVLKINKNQSINLTFRLAMVATA